MNMDDFIRCPADYIALYMPVSIPPMQTRPGFGNLPKPLFSITYGECKKIHNILKKLDKNLSAKKRSRKKDQTVITNISSLMDQLREIITYGEYITTHPNFNDDDDAYNLTTFINDFTNSTANKKSKYPEFSGTTRHKITIRQLKSLTSAAKGLEAIMPDHDEDYNIIPIKQSGEMEVV